MRNTSADELETQEAQVLRIARAIGHPEPEEVVQQVALLYLKAVNSHINIRNAKAWFSRVAKRAAIASAINNRKSPPAFSDDLEDDADLVHPLISEERDLLLHEAVASLPRQQQEVVQAVALNGQTFSSFAATVGCSVNTCKSRFYRAMRILKDDPRLRSIYDA